MTTLIWILGILVAILALLTIFSYVLGLVLALRSMRADRRSRKLF